MPKYNKNKKKIKLSPLHLLLSVFQTLNTLHKSMDACKKRILNATKLMDVYTILV